MAKTPRIYQSDKNPVGMIVSSMLTETQFQALNGTSWILMDGRNIAGSKYATVTGATTISDARGMVLRGTNNGGSAQGSRSDGNQNPDGNMAPGVFQGDSFGSHAHTQDAHYHLQGTRMEGQSMAYGQTYSPAGSVIREGESTTGNPYATNTNTVQPGIQASGGNETRMKNIAVNHFIKIND